MTKLQDRYQDEIGAINFKTFTINSPYLSQYGHRIDESRFNR